MPRILIEVNEAWLIRLQQVIPAAIDALTGWQHQIQSGEHSTHQEAENTLKILHGQMEDLRRNLESVSMIF